MKNFLLSLLIICLGASLQAQNDIPSFFGFNTFNTSSETPYVEANFAVNAQDLTFQRVDSNFQAGVVITVLFMQEDDVVNFDKFNLLTRKVANVQEADFNVTTQRSIALPNGTYDVEVIIKDYHKPERKSVYPNEQLTIDYEPQQIGISDFHLIKQIEKKRAGSAFNKNGYNLIPYFINYYPETVSKMHFYAEVYNLDEAYLDEDILVTYSLHQPGNDRPVENLKHYMKQKGAPVNVVMGSLDISELSSGRYDFKVQVRNRENKLLAEKSMAIYRKNKRPLNSTKKDFTQLNVANTFVQDLDPEDMEWYLKGLKPISNSTEERTINTVLASEDSTLQRKFIYHFWSKRNLNDPEHAWDEYLSKLKYVRQEFSVLNRYGFETDRGRIYLEYGPPAERFESHFESNSEPYEIWRYNRTYFGETNVKFVFKSTDLVSNDFRLLHSDATGEAKNPNWKSVLDGKFPNPGGLDPHDPRESMGNSNSEIFD